MNDALSDTPIATARKSSMHRGAWWWIKRVVKWLLGGLMIIPILGMLPMGIDFLIEFPLRLLFGWISFLYESLPLVKLQLEMILSSVAALIIASFGLHFSARSLCAKVSGGKQTWSPRSSLAVVVVLLLLFSVTLAGAGIVHQVGWLRSETLMEDSRRSRALLFRKSSTLCKALQEWELAHDTYPLQLKDLLEIDERNPLSYDPLLVQFGPELTPEPWMFLAAGKSTKTPSEKPLVVSPRPDENGRRIAVYSNGPMVFLQEAKYQALMALPDSEP